MLSRPPASTSASAPYRSSSCSASSTVPGWYSSKTGIMSRITAISCLPVARIAEGGLRIDCGSCQSSISAIRIPQSAISSSDVSRQRFVRPVAAVLERCQDDVGRAPATAGTPRRRPHPAIAFMIAPYRRADRRFADAADAGRRFRIRNVHRRPTSCSAARRESSAACSGRTARQRDAVLLVVGPALADGVAEAQHRSAEQLALQAARVEDGADVADRGVVDHLDHAGLGVDLDFREADDVGLRLRRRADTCPWPRAISPWPASAFADVFVKALMSSGTSWPSYLPPSSIAFCAACANVMLPPGPDTRRRRPCTPRDCRRASSPRSPAAS